MGRLFRRDFTTIGNESREHYLGLVTLATIELIDGGYLLGGDLPLILESAGER